MGRAKSTLRFTPDELCLLREVVAKRCMMNSRLLSVSSLAELRSREIAGICQAITDEFCSTGLKPDSEPNTRGLKLESLLDKLHKVGEC